MYYFTIDLVTTKTVHIVSLEYRDRYKSLFNAVLPLYSVFDREVKDTRNIHLDVCGVENEEFDLHIITNDASYFDALKVFQAKVKRMHDALADEL